MVVDVTATGCPTDDLLGAHVQRVLDETQASEIAAHLDRCDSCREIVIAAVRGAATSPAVPRPRSAARGAHLERGARIGRYVIEDLLGAGGMGHVYRAHDAELDRAIALKILRPELAASSAALVDRLVRESRMMAKIAHPAVITVHDVGREGDTLFIAMELIRGETLGAWIARTKPSWREIVAVFERAAAGLAAAHDAGVIHRDFKPENVLLELTDGVVSKVVVTDFGIARTASTGEDATTAPGARRPDDVRLTATGSAIGTPAYMAPEQLAGEPVDLRADVFAFCVAMWEALFGQRPFPGKTVEEIRASMTGRPRRSHRRVPGRLARVLERGLAVSRGDRWSDMRAVGRELAAVRARRRRLVIAALAAGLVGVGTLGSLALAHPAAVDPCSAAREPFARDTSIARLAVLHTRLATLPAVATRFDDRMSRWRQTHEATCHADQQPAQPVRTAACLEARREEIAAGIDDVILDGPTDAASLVTLVSDPAACADPPPGLMLSRVPADPVLRRKVTALRHRAFVAESARDRGEFERATIAAQAVVEEAAHVWPVLHAETLYLLGTIQSQAGDPKLALATLRQAAAVAEGAHHDYIAVSAWTQLVITVTFDQGDPKRGLEYVTYAEAALARLGDQPLAQALLEYAKGAALVEADRSKEGEVALRHAVEIAEKRAPTLIATTIQGLGYLYEDQARNAEAVEAYRTALARMDAQGSAGSASERVTFRERLSSNLSQIGKSTEAEAIAREAVAVADASLSIDSADRYASHGNLASILSDGGRSREALVEAAIATAGIKRILGERSERYGEALLLEGALYVDLGDFPKAEKRYARACEIMAFATGDTSSNHAECLLAETDALQGLGRRAEALAMLDKVIPLLIGAYTSEHPRVATAYEQRGALHADMGHHAAAIADLEQAVAVLAQRSPEPGHLAEAQWRLGRELWTREPKRARMLVDTALTTLATAAPGWEPVRTEAAAWRAKHPR